MSAIDRVATAVSEYSWAVIALMVVTTAVMGAGVGGLEQSSGTRGIQGESDAAAAYSDIRNDFSTRPANVTVTMIAVQNESGNALSKASLVHTLEYQQALRDNATVNATLVDDDGTVSVANVIARAAIAAEQRQKLPNCCRTTGWSGSSHNATNATAGAPDQRAPPTLDEQIAQFQSMDSEAVATVVEQVLDPDSSSAARRGAYRLLPQKYEPGSTTATSHLLVMTQETDGAVQVDVALSDRVSNGQRAARAIAKDRAGSERFYVFGGGLLSGQQSKAMSDSLSILGPLAILFVLLALTIAYRDPIDIVLGLVGVFAVLVWTFGTMGWLGFEFNQTMIAVPILLIGLSVDYALHVIMRYREERERSDDGARPAMARSLVGVGPALVLVTMTTAIGVLANLTSALPDIQAFGFVSAIGITSTLFVFGLFVPALKTSVSSLLSRVGWDRTSSSLGSAGGVRRLLGAGASVAHRAPLVIIVIAVLLTAGGAVGASQIDVATPETGFMADEPPEWTENLPEQVQPGEFYLKENREFIYSTFQAPDMQGYVLVEGNVTSPGTLDRVAAAEETAGQSTAVLRDPSGGPVIATPLSAMGQAARQNETFNATFSAADTDGDSVPDRNLESLYDEFFATTPDLATRTLHRTDDGEYTALRMRIAVNGNLDRDAVVAPLDDVAVEFDGVSGTEATPTGPPVIAKNLNDGLATTLVESLAITLVVILALLMVVFRLTRKAASLGVITLVPVVFSVTWLLGTMALLDIPIGFITALVGSISVGLGVDYAIHVSERFAEEYHDTASTETALIRTVTGTGSTLMSSAITTAVGFGVLSFSLLPALQQFGIVLALGIVYSFVASVYVQPSLLALWTRYGPTTVPSEASTVPAWDD
jgi:predicted RND superfamily exporter protein